MAYTRSVCEIHIVNEYYWIYYGKKYTLIIEYTNHRYINIIKLYSFNILLIELRSSEPNFNFFFFSSSSRLLHILIKRFYIYMALICIWSYYSQSYLFKIYKVIYNFNSKKN